MAMTIVACAVKITTQEALASNVEMKCYANVFYDENVSFLASKYSKRNL